MLYENQQATGHLAGGGGGGEVRAKSAIEGAFERLEKARTALSHVITKLEDRLQLVLIIEPPQNPGIEKDKNDGPACSPIVRHLDGETINILQQQQRLGALLSRLET